MPNLRKHIIFYIAFVVFIFSSNIGLFYKLDYVGRFFANLFMVFGTLIGYIYGLFIMTRDSSTFVPQTLKTKQCYYSLLVSILCNVVMLVVIAVQAFFHWKGDLIDLLLFYWAVGFSNMFAMLAGNRITKFLYSK